MKSAPKCVCAATKKLIDGELKCPFSCEQFLKPSQRYRSAEAVRKRREKALNRPLGIREAIRKAERRVVPDTFLRSGYQTEMARARKVER